MNATTRAGQCMEIVSRRFLLRDFVAADAAAFEAYHADPRYLRFYAAEEARPGHARELLALFQAWAAEQPRRNWQLAIVSRDSPQVLIGCCGLRSAAMAAGSAEFGIELSPDYWARYSYAIEVMHALMAVGFAKFGLRVVHGRTAAANSSIVRLASAFGAEVVRTVAPESGRAEDQGHLEWRITREQWNASRLVQRLGGRLGSTSP